ncbi:MAG: NFACT family protein, partial [Halobacteria archaeon]|nr:NFACT family protein [Halobacteria archaeon]
LTDSPEEAPERPPNLPMLMRKRLSSGELRSVEQYDFDRIVTIEGEREEAYTMVAELFGDGNFSFLDSDGVVLRCLETVRLKTRTVAAGDEYEYPPSRIDPLELSFDGFVETMESSDTDFVRTLASQLNFGGLYAEEICARAGIDKETPIEEADEDDYRALYDSMQDVFEPITSDELSPHIVYEGDDGGDERQPVDVLPFELRKYSEDSYEHEYYDSFNEALDDYFELLEEHEEEQHDQDGGIEAEIQKQKAIIRQQDEAIEEFEEEAHEYREKAETIYAHYGVVDELLDTVKEARADGFSWDEIRGKLDEGSERGIESAEIVERIDDGNERVYVELDGYEIELDPAEGVETNASRLYNEAKEVEDKREGAIEAKQEREGELERLKRERENEDDGDGDSDSDG